MASQFSNGLKFWVFSHCDSYELESVFHIVGFLCLHVRPYDRRHFWTLFLFKRLHIFISKILIISFVLSPDLVQNLAPNLHSKFYFLFRFMRSWPLNTFFSLSGMYWRSCTLLTGLITINSGIIKRYILYYLESDTFSSLVLVAVACKQ